MEGTKMRSTMQEYPLTVGAILRHGTETHGDARVITATATGTRSMTYAEVRVKAAQLANALKTLGITGDERVATFQWNNAEHLVSYLAIPSMGAIMHTLNIRLFPEQLTFIANHAEDKVVIVDDSLVPLLAKQLGSFETVEHVIVAGPDAASSDLDSLRATGKQVHLLDELLSQQPETFDWPELDEFDAAVMAYTSGTTGNPKGVAYSHRTTYLHSMAVGTANVAGLSWSDTMLPIVPMFHANAWGMAYGSMLTGANLAMPDRWLQAEPLVRFMQASRPTISAAVPTVWNDLLTYLDQHPEVNLSEHLNLILCGGSPVPVALQQALKERHNLAMVQAWGMTETSPVASVARPPLGIAGEEEWAYRASQGRIVAGVEARIVGESGEVLERGSGEMGEIEIRGAWITGSYYKDDDPEKFRDGWLRTGDVGTLDVHGYFTLTDRAKDVIKSGGEWISSVDLENALMAHPAVLEAAVVGIPHPKWQERPLAVVVLREGSTATADELRTWLAQSFAKWQLPDAWAFSSGIPRTSVGKFDKKVLRQQYSDGELDVVTTDAAAAALT